MPHRELRKVPAGWEHPRKPDGTYQPIFNQFYEDIKEEYLTNVEKWNLGTHLYLIEDPSLKEKYPFYRNWNGDLPDPVYYQSKKYSNEELTHIQLYENTSGGTPISPVFHRDDFEKLCEWASKNAYIFASTRMSKEEWINALKSQL